MSAPARSSSSPTRREGLRADRIWFMEMNTRLQVEHPVTEEITGQDLVEWQLRVASGEPLPMTPGRAGDQRPGDRGAALCRGPGQGLPAERRAARAFRSAATDGRIDTGVEEGDAISPFYDPMIAKLIARGDDRDEAIGELAAILDEVEVWPVKTNAGFLFNALLRPGFRRRADRHRLHRAQPR